MIFPNVLRPIGADKNHFYQEYFYNYRNITNREVDEILSAADVEETKENY